MTNDESAAQCEPRDANAVDSTQLEIDFHAACYRFSAALTTMRIAHNAAGKASEREFVLGRRCTPDELQSLDARRTAASRVMQLAIDAIVREGFELLEAIQALLSA